MSVGACNRGSLYPLGLLSSIKNTFGNELIRMDLLLTY